jgi:Rrf2 family protein
VNLSAKVEYACIAMLELAMHWGNDEPLRIREIAEAHAIPPRFLVQILLQLKGAGLVHSTRGATGGYVLARAPEKISLYDVMSVIDGTVLQPQRSEEHDSAGNRVLQRAWMEIARVEQNMLRDMNFGDLALQLKHPQQEMYYI